MCSNRGIGGNKLIIVDEMAFTSESLFHNCVLVAWGVGNTVAIGISTINPDDSNNHFTRLVNERDVLIKVFMFSLVCPACMESDPRRRDVCLHRIHMLPPWKANRKAKTIQRLMDNNPRAQMTELLGVSFKDEQQVFSEEMADMLTGQMVSTPERLVGAKSSHIHVTVDPYAGGEGSRYAILSGIVEGGTTTIVGMENESPTISLKANVCALAELIVGHVRAVRAKFELTRRSDVVCYIESNLANESVWIAHTIRQILPEEEVQGWIFFTYNDVKGVRTSNATKRFMIEGLHSMINTKNFTIHSGFAVSGAEYSRDRQALIKEYKRQLLEFRRHRKITKKTGRVTVTYHGKHNLNPDDLVMGSGMMSFYPTVFYESLFEAVRKGK